MSLPREVIHATTRAGQHVLLRPPVEADAVEVAQACRDAEIARFLTELPQPYGHGDALSWITTVVPAQWAAGAAGFVVADASTGRLLGAAGLAGVRAGGRAAGVGYWTAPWARRQGVTTTAVRALARWAYAHGVQRLEVLTALANEGSQRVALAAGFRHEGLRRAYGPAGGHRLADRAAWVRLDTDPDAPTPRAFPDLPAGGLTDGVVTLRRLSPADADAKFALDILPDVQAGSVRATPTPEDTRERCERAAYDWLAGNRAAFAILDAPSGSFAGDIGAFHPDPTGQLMIGYSVAPEWRGRGFATRAARLVVAWAFEAGYARVIAGTTPDNKASQAVLEGAGLTREGYERSRLPTHDGTPRKDNIPFAITSPATATERPAEVDEAG